MKIGVFSGVYYCRDKSRNDGKTTLSTYRKLQKALSDFQKEKVDLCFCIGNLADQECQDKKEVLWCFEAVSELIKLYDISFYFVPAPGDFLKTDLQDLTRLLGLYRTQYTIHADDTLFIVLDGNYTADMNHFGERSYAQSDFYLPPEQIASLKYRLRMSKKCVVLTYHNIDGTVPSRFALKNAQEVREIIKAHGHTPLVLQGAYPFANDNLIDGTRYITVPSMRDSTTDFYKIIEI